MITALTELDSLERMDVKITQQRVDLPNFRRCFFNKTSLFLRPYIIMFLQVIRVHV